jgi:hypothetical protein
MSEECIAVNEEMREGMLSELPSPPSKYPKWTPKDRFCTLVTLMQGDFSFFYIYVIVLQRHCTNRTKRRTTIRFTRASKEDEQKLRDGSGPITTAANVIRL